MIKGAIIGLGKMGISHASIINAHPKVELKAVCDTSSFILEGFNKYTSIKTYSDYQKMLDAEDLDFVVVATPPTLHYPMVKDAFEKNLHVFCEKPFSLNVSQGEELVRIAHLKNLVNQVGYNNHFIGTFIELKRLIKAGILDEIVAFKGEGYGPVVVKEKGDTWRSKASEGGGCLFDYASHALNLIQEILGKPTQIKGAILKSIYSNGVDDAVYALLQLENNLSGLLSVNWSDETYRKMTTSLTIEGKNGKIICDATEIKIYLKQAKPQENLKKGLTIKYITDFVQPVNFYLRGEEYSSQIDYFISHIESSKQGSINTFEQALYTDKVIEMILEKSKI
jgi:predicted dehydrogenase